MARVSNTKLMFYFVLDAILTLLIAFGPSGLLFHFLAPGDFFQRLVAAIFCGALFLVMGVIAFFFFVWFISETTGI
jgi:hypothetical protein